MILLDISALGIRVLNKRNSNSIYIKQIKDVEGTVLRTIAHSNYVYQQLKKDNLLKLMCEMDEHLEFNIRWDNDTKTNVFANMLYIRDFGKLQIYDSIWDDECLKDLIDDRPFHTLRPYTVKKKLIRKKLSFINTLFAETAPIASPIPTTTGTVTNNNANLIIDNF